MTTHQKENRCPKCQAPVPPEAPQGLCPKCVLAAVSAPTESGARSESKSLPPLEMVAAAFPQLEILEMIGRGGMGIVYKARQPKLDRFVALKLLPQGVSDDPTFTERFNREGRLLARLSHPNIVTVHDFGQSQGFYYLILEYVDGVNLRQAMRAARFTPTEALTLVPKICEALQYAHDEGVLHRDIKPENILLDTRGRVKIADFGIAKLAGDETKDDKITASGAALGTPHYMAPEQIEHPGDVDHRADIYSLGVVFYEMLTGELPIGRFAPPSQKNPIDPRLDDVVLRALEKERERRYQSASEVKIRIETLATNLGDESAPSRTEANVPCPQRSQMSAPAWINRVAILFTVLGLVSFLPTLITFGEAVRVWNVGTLMTLTGIALLTLRPRWRMAALIGNSIGLGFGALSLLLLFFMRTISKAPAEFQLDVPGIPNSPSLAIILALFENLGFLAGIWVLCRSDVKALFDSNPPFGDDTNPRRPSTPSLRPPMAPPAGSVKESQGSSKAVVGSVLTGLSLMISVPFLLRWLAAVAFPAADATIQIIHPIFHWAIPGLLICLTATFGVSGLILGLQSLKEISRGNGNTKGIGLALFAVLAWPSVASLLIALAFGYTISAFLPAQTNAAVAFSLMISTLSAIAVEALFAEWLWRWAKGATQVQTMNSNLQQPQRVGSVALWTLCVVGGPVFLVGLICSGFYFSSRAVILNATESPNPPRVPTKKDSVTRIKSVFLGRLKIADRNITLQTDSSIFPGESVVALFKRPDGQMVESLTTTYAFRKNLGASTSTIFTWQVPESFGVDPVRSANIETQKFEERPITLVAGKPYPLFKVRNSVGSVLEAFIELKSVNANSANSPETSRASVRFSSVTNAPGILIAFVTPMLPPGAVLQAVGLDTDGQEVETHTSSGRSPVFNSYTCRWNFPPGFEQENIQSATEQMQRLTANGPLILNPGARNAVFSSTNHVGEVFRGYLELMLPVSADKP